jgi:hypothetical protein
MEAHPVPQNVTSFQFRLIGDMTLKQFGYLGAGVGFAYLIFVFLAAPFPLIAWPVIVISSFLGIAFAFLPIQDRPLDHWVAAFLKAIYSPTKRIWKKNGKDYKSDLTFKNRMNIYLTVKQAMSQPLISTTPTISPAVTATAAIANIPTTTLPSQPEIMSQLPTVFQSKPIPEIPTSEELSQTVDLGKKAQALQVEIIEQEKELTKIKSEATAGTIDRTEYTKVFNSVFEKLQHLVSEASDIKKQLEVITQEPTPQKPEIKVQVVRPKLQPTPMVLTSTPNVINGIIVDTSGNYLDGVVVVIHDKEGLPVRALKTNKLGQFTGSTPLSNGTFNIELEKDGYIFDIQQVELDGKTLPPLMVSAKTVQGTS